MQTFIINLDNELHRKKDMELKLKKINITNYTFFKAIDGKNELHNYSFEIMSNWKDYFKNREITVGEIGCALSHWNLWLHIIRNNIEISLILEDDVTFSTCFNEELNALLKTNLKKDFIYLSSNKLNNIFNLGKEEQINNLLVKTKYCYNMHSYIITLDGCKKLTSTNFLYNLLPIDEYLPIMYDNEYPFKEYSCYFDKYEKIICYSLYKNITEQETNKYKSSIDNSIIYRLYKNMQNKIKCWNVDINSQIIDIIIKFFDNSKQYNIIWNLDLTKNTYSIIEKIIYDIIVLNCNEYGIDINNIFVSFWLRHEDYNFEFTHMHIDHCDYEYNMYGTITNKPIKTTILYFDNSIETPTIITDINEENKNTNNFYSSKQLILSFPKKNKLISFDSTKYHGECYLNNSAPKKRRAFVIAIWEKSKTPKYTTTFNINSFILNLAFEKDSIIEYAKKKYNSNELLLIFKNDLEGIVDIKIQNNNIINETFLKELIINRSKTCVYPLTEIISNYNIDKYHTFIIDLTKINLYIPDIKINNIYISQFIVNPKIDFIVFNNMLRNFDNLNDKEEEYLLNEQKNMSLIEKYICDIAYFHINRLKLISKKIYISWKISNTNELKHNFNSNLFYPIYNIITNINNKKKSPVIIGSIDTESYKYKEYEKSDILLINLKHNEQLCFHNNYDNFFSFFKDALIIKLWVENPNFNNYPFINDNSKYLLNDLPVININNNIKIFESLVIEHDNKEDFYDNLLYNRDVTELNKLTNNLIIDKHTIINFKIIDRKILKEYDENLKKNKFQKMKFII